MNSFKTPQEAFWAGEFGNDYINRNQWPQFVASNVAFFSKILQRTGALNSIIELGANIGLNLAALRVLMPTCELTAVEINNAACEFLLARGDVKVVNQSLLGFVAETPNELVFTKGVLIHIAPELLSRAYEVMYQCSRRYILVAEYYNPQPITISYRGHEDRLFKRDFAGELLDRYPDLRLVDYGFVYGRDSTFPQDDVTWFLLEKQS